MTHQIINEVTGGIICDEAIIKEVNHALDHDMDHTYFNEKRIDILSSKSWEREKVTFIAVEE